MDPNLTEIVAGVYCLGPWGRFQTNVYLVRSGSSWVLIDAGWAGDATRIEQAAQLLLGDVRPAAILLIHCHPDHSGSAGELARRWGCLVWMHPAELPIARGDFAARWAGPLDRWIVLPSCAPWGRGDVKHSLPAGA